MRKRVSWLTFENLDTLYCFTLFVPSRRFVNVWNGVFLSDADDDDDALMTTKTTTSKMTMANLVAQRILANIVAPTFA